MKRRPRYRRHRDTVAGERLRRLNGYFISWHGRRCTRWGWEIVGTGFAVHFEAGGGWFMTHRHLGHLVFGYAPMPPPSPSRWLAVIRGRRFITGLRRLGWEAAGPWNSEDEFFAWKAATPKAEALAERLRRKWAREDARNCAEAKREKAQKARAARGAVI